MSTYDVIIDIDRPDEELVRRFAKIQSATIHEAMGKRGALPHTIRPIWPENVVCGTALTVTARPGDNLMLHKAVSIARPGNVLVVENQGFLEGGMWGEIITTAAMAKGITGLITNGAVRDTVPIRKLGFPIFCRGLSIKGTSKVLAGKINHPVYFDAVEINPGDILVGDNDGIVVIPKNEAESVLQASLAKEIAEAEMMERVRNGESTMDILNLNKPYKNLNLSERRG